MKCTNCGFESPEGVNSCANCGAVLNQELVSRNPAAEKILAALKDKLFLVICILLSVSLGLGVLAGSFNIITILLVIFLWMVYSNSTKDVVDTKNLRRVSGTVYASYVIANVAFVMLAVAGVIIGLVFDALTKEAEFIAMLEKELATMNLEIEVSQIIERLQEGFGWLFAGVFLFVAAVGLIVNLCGLRKIHRLAKSVYMSVDMADLSLIKKANAAKNWLWVFGVCSAITVLSGDWMAVVSGGCSAAAYILAAILVKKYLVEDPFAAQ